jgi:hypothetical protein
MRDEIPGSRGNQDPANGPAKKYAWKLLLLANGQRSGNDEKYPVEAVPTPDKNTRIHRYFLKIIVYSRKKPRNLSCPGWAQEKGRQNRSSHDFGAARDTFPP